MKKELKEPIIKTRIIIERNIQYSADYSTGGLWRATSVEKGCYRGEVREIEGKLFSASVFESDKGNTYQHLVWIRINSC